MKDPDFELMMLKAKKHELADKLATYAEDSAKYPQLTPKGRKLKKAIDLCKANGYAVTAPMEIS